MPFESINPTTGERIRSFASLDDRALDVVLERAREAFDEHRGLPLAERARRLEHAGAILEAESADFGRLMALEMGKPLQQAVAEAEKCAWVCRHYAERGGELLTDESVETEAARSYVRYQPLGPILAIMPWNFPFWQVFRCAAPALMAGNVVLLKHASNVPRCALALEDVFRRSGFDEGAFQNLFIEVEQVGRAIADPRVRAVTLTGSRRAGRDVARKAGEALKKSVLELGGSDPFVVLPSADLQEAAATAVRARTLNSGQSCIAAKRMIVHDAVADEFQERFVQGMADLSVGDPLDEENQVGPLATRGGLETLEDQVARSVEAGARVLTGGGRLDGDGFFYRPTVLTDVPEGCPAYMEELFGPVASLFRVPDVDAAIRLANDTVFGLGASVWTEDSDEHQRLVKRLETGLVFVNALVASDPRLPFGGVKESGYGRELGVHGLREFVNVKTIWVAAAGDAEPDA